LEGSSGGETRPAVMIDTAQRRANFDTDLAQMLSRYIVTARLDRKRRAVTVAEASIPHARVVWARDTIHDVQLQRTE
jgi:hypothetical protein